MRAALAAGLAALVLIAPATGAEVRTAVPRDGGAHPGPGERTEWWFAGASDPGQDLSVAVALGAEFPATPPATVVFLYLPGGATHVVGAIRARGPVATDRSDVRLGPDRLWSPAPGVHRVTVDMDAGIALHGEPPGPVALDLTLRSSAPGFTAGPLELPGGQSLWWTVAAPTARVTGTVRVGDRTFRLDGAPGYHDHNFGPFDLADEAHGGWDWSQVHLPQGRSLVTGIVRPSDPAPRGGTAVLSGTGGRLATAPARAVRVTRDDWDRVGDHHFPRAVTLTMRMTGGWSAQVRYTARRAAPLSFTRDGSSALVEVEARAAGSLSRDGRVVARWTDAPGFYEYESTAVTRQRDRVPGSAAWAGRLCRDAADALRR
ncbi:MAG: hypothetical protein AB7V62_04335 [Thermoleophilia bacterium]